MRLSRHFSLLVFVRGDFARIRQFHLRFVVRSVGSSVWGPAFSLPVFGFLVFLWRRGRLAFSTLLASSVSGMQFRTLLRRCQPCAMRVRPFCFFREPVITCGFPYFFSPFGFVRCRFAVSNNFVLWFVYLDGSSSIFGIHLLMQFSFSSVFRPAMSQRPSLVFLVRFFRA